MTTATTTTTTMTRPYRGSRVSSFYPVKSLPPISSLDSAFQLQEYISLLIRRDVHDVDAIVALPGKPTPEDTIDSPESDTKKPEDADRKSDIAVDRACWIYEQLRRLAQDLSHPLITMLQQECTRGSCPQMKAGEWLYLCVAHGNDGAMEQCCAIDYILHTVDSATALLNSPRAFPSRLSIPQTSHRHFSSLARRLGRIFAHAYFHHREAFEQAEAESSLYARFLKLTSQFDLVPPEFLVIPESALHHDEKDLPEEVEPPRLFSAAVHPTPSLPNDALATETSPDVDLASSSRPQPVDSSTNQFGTDSPRKLGRSRTDTMVFSEAFNVAEELSKGEEGSRSTGSSLLGSSLGIEALPEQSWTDLQARTEEPDDEDTSDARSEVTISGPLSPPVEAMSLISLEDAPSALPPIETAPALPSEPLQHEPPSDAPGPEISVEEPVPVVDLSVEHAVGDEPSTAEVVVLPSEEANVVGSEALAETLHTLSEPTESTVEVAHEKIDPAPLSEEPKGMEEHAEPELPLPPPPEVIFELNEPPPSEPIPPESESDITDEVGALDGNEVKQGGEEGAVTSPKHLVG